jgi:hypothetical protein
MIRTIETVCLHCQGPPLSESLSRRVAGLYPSPHVQHRLTVSLGVSARWYHSVGRQLLDALSVLTANGGAR